MTPAAGSADTWADARRFLRALWQWSADGDALDDEVEAEVRPISGAKKAAKQNPALWSYTPATTIDQVLALAGKADAAGADVYYGVHLRARGTTKASEAAGRVLTACFADVDVVKHGLDRAAVFALAHSAPWGPPSASIWSGGGWHFYWLYREQLDARDERTFGEHQRAAGWVRAWLNDGLGLAAADHMSSRDRILRIPGCHNWKPAYAIDGVSPLVELVEIEPDRQYQAGDIVEFIPGDWAGAPAPSAPGAPSAGAALDPADLPTEVPARLRAVAAAAKVQVRPIRGGGTEGGIRMLALSRCPACGQTDGACRLTPLSGRLVSFHANSCPAGAGATGARPGSELGRGIPLHTWVGLYAPEAIPALRESEARAGRSYRQAEDTRTSTAFMELAEVGTDAALAAALRSAGVPDLVVESIVLAGDAIHVQREVEGSGRLARAIAQNAPEGGGALLPLRDASGAVRTGAWLEGDDLRLVRSKLVGAVGDFDGAFVVLGDPQAALRAGVDGRPVVLCATWREYLAAQALVVTGLLDAAVLGAVNPTWLGRAVRYLRNDWARSRTIPPQVIIVGGAELAPVAKLLDGRAGVAWFKPAVGHLSAAIEAVGLPSAATALERAPVTYARPIDILQSGDRILSDLKRAAILATNITSHGRRTVVVYQVPPGAGKSRQALQLAADFVTGAAYIPVRGHRPPSVPPEQWPPKNRAVVFATPSHKLAEEKYNDLPGIAPGVQRALLKGAEAYCQFRQNVADVYPAVGRRGICGPDPDTVKPEAKAWAESQRCPLAVTCPGAAHPVARRGEVSCCAHAMVASLKPDFAFIDETPGVVELEQRGDAEILSLFAARMHPKVKKWRSMTNPDAGEAARLLAQAVSPLAHAHAAEVTAGRIDPFPRWVTGDELASLIESVPGLVGALNEGFHGAAVPPPVPSPVEARSGVHSGAYMPSRLAFQAMQRLLTFYRRWRELDGPGEPVLDPAAVPPAPVASLCLHTDGTWGLEVRSVLPLPDCPVVILDGTGELTLAEWEAAYPDRTVKMLSLRVAGTAPADAIHLETGMVTRKRLFDALGRVKPGTAARFRRIFARCREALTEVHTDPTPEAPLRLALLTYKRIYDAMMGALPNPGPEDVELRQAIADLALGGVQVSLGYFGKHDRGTNDYESVEALVVVGDATPNVGAVAADCVLLGLDPAAVATARAQSTLVQAAFRARHTRRSDSDRAVLVFVGQRAPEIAGLAWEPEPLADVAPSGSPRHLAAEICRIVLREAGCVGPKPIELFDWVGFGMPAAQRAKVARSTLETILREIADEQGLIRVELPDPNRRAGRPISVWARCAEDAHLWASMMFGWPVPNFSNDSANLPGGKNTPQETSVPPIFGANFPSDSAILPDIGYIDPTHARARVELDTDAAVDPAARWGMAAAGGADPADPAPDDDDEPWPKPVGS